MRMTYAFVKYVTFERSDVVYLVSNNTCSLGQLDTGMPIKGVYSKKYANLSGEYSWNYSDVSVGMKINDRITTARQSGHIVGAEYCLYVKDKY